MTLVRIVACFAVGMIGGHAGLGFAQMSAVDPAWQGVSVSVGEAWKPKLEGTEGRAISLVGRDRGLAGLVGVWVPELDAWRWRPVISAGHLYRPDAEDGVQVLTIGAEVERRLTGLPLPVEPYLAFGFSPTVLSDGVLGALAIGGDFHFTSSVTAGFMLQTPLPVRVAYRWAHTSNGGIRSDNPGLDLSGVVVEFPLLIR